MKAAVVHALFALWVVTLCTWIEWRFWQAYGRDR